MQIYSTLSRQKEPFQTREQGKVAMYVCGMTPYDSMHVGHGRCFFVFDVIRRYLEWRGYEVFHVQNVTDIEDKIIGRAKELGMNPLELADHFHRESVEDMKAFGLLLPHVMPKVSEHLAEITELISVLIQKGYAYQVNGDVYFSVSRYEQDFPYGQLSRRSRDELIAGARVEVDERKRDPMDFSLWKSAKEGEPAWDSPWGKGRPGWHIECSAMSLKYLGSGFDIHGGSTDLIFPHHENEIAQSQAFTGSSPFVRYWVYAGQVTMNGEKMSKSLGNFITLREAMHKHGVNALKLMFLQTHYRTPLDYSDEKVKQAKSALERLRIALQEAKTLLQRDTGQGTRDTNLEPQTPKSLVEAAQRAREHFIEAMDDDFNTARALSAVFALVGEINELMRGVAGLTASEKEALQAARSTVLELLGVFGISGIEEEERMTDLTKQLIELLIEVRHQLRQKKEFSVADKIRAELGKLGIVLEDKAQGTSWRRAM